MHVTLDISVIICAYTQERWHDLVAAVESVRRQSVLPHEIIVVIDHNARLLEQVRVHIPDVIVTENYEPRGLSGARNSGIAMAQGALIAFLDDDTIAEPDWLVRELPRSGRGWFSRAIMVEQTASMVPRGILLGCGLHLSGFA